MEKDIAKKDFDFQKKMCFLKKQISSGKMTINEARKVIGLPQMDGAGYNTYVMSEKFRNRKMINP